MMECLNGCYGLFIFNRNETKDIISYSDLEAVTRTIRNAEKQYKCFSSHGWSANIVPVSVTSAMTGQTSLTRIEISFSALYSAPSGGHVWLFIPWMVPMNLKDMDGAYHARCSVTARTALQ